jgi:hypothetical protein
MRTILALFAALLLSFAPARASAQSDPSHAAAARALFQEGVGLARAGSYAEAIDRFRRAQALHPAGPVAFNLASALVHQGELVEASEMLARLLRDPSITRVIQTAAERLRAEIAPRLARLRVRVAGDAEGVRVELDARELPSAAVDVPMPVDPGAHEIVAQRGDEEVARERVELAEGESRELVLTIARREIPAPVVPRAALEAPPPRREEPSLTPVAVSGRDDGVWIGIGVGLAVLAVGAVTTTAVVLTMPQGPMPVSGNAMPGVLTW